jgi:phosphotransferase system HPr-like phosphotransfer protein
MVEEKIVVHLEYGLQARDATEFVQKSIFIRQ